MRPPTPRGPVSAAVREALLRDPQQEPFLEVRVPDELGDLLRDDDLQLALWMLYEQSYRTFDGAHDHEWDPAAVAVRRKLELPFEQQLRTAVQPMLTEALRTEGDIGHQIEHAIGLVPGPDLSRFLHREATREQLLDFLAQRSVYHLKESDPHSFVVGRVGGPAKVALAELQYDEFGAGRPDRLHSSMYAVGLEAAGLDSRFGAYIDRVPASTLAVNNVMSLFGLSHRLRAAALGHLAAFESTSSVPCRRIAAGIERVGLPAEMAAYFHEHVEADAVHEQVVQRDICGSFVESEPSQRAEVLFGAIACIYLDSLAAEDLLVSWGDGVGGELAS
ncbi:MAG: iron-containing redox enzyme family protein [Nocardioides sp.]